MARKKIIFVIVEGISDDEALGVILSRYFSNDTVYLHIMHCDITSEYNVNANNIIKKIGNAVSISTSDLKFNSERGIRTLDTAGMNRVL